MQRLDMEVEIARTCQREPKRVRLGRKELYELKRDWGSMLAFASDEKKFEQVLGLVIERVNETEWLEGV
jgi:hypothetical protein